MIEIKPTTEEDCQRLLARPPEWPLRAMTAWVDGVPVAIGGLALLPDGTVTTFLEESGHEVVKRFPVAFYRAARRGLAEMRASGLPRLFGVTDERVEAAPRWLLRLGFEPTEHPNIFVLEL